MLQQQEPMDKYCVIHQINVYQDLVLIVSSAMYQLQKVAGNSLEPVKQTPVKQTPVNTICPGGRQSCPAGDTCCPRAYGQWACCPLLAVSSSPYVTNWSVEFTS